MPLSRIAPAMQRAAIVAEDARFWEHDGVDWDALRGAAEKNLEKGAIKVGGSTITQQLAKNLYLSPARTPWRKLRELAIARRLERALSKKRILELYQNVIEFGPRTFGVEAAARRFMGKSARDLSREEAATLAAVIPCPHLRPRDAQGPGGAPRPANHTLDVTRSAILTRVNPQEGKGMRPVRGRGFIGAGVGIGVFVRMELMSVGCPRGPASLDGSPKKVNIYGLERAQRMTIRVLDKKGQPVDGTPQWSSANPGVVAAEDGGRLVAKSAGKAMVTASLGDLQVQVPVEVVDVSSVEMSTPSLVVLGPIGTSVPLSYVVKDSKGKVVSLKPSFSSHDPNIVKVDDEGVVTSAAAGKSTIVGRIGDVQGGCDVEVVVHAISRLEVRPATALVHVGDSQHFQVTAYGPDGIPVPDVAAAFKSSNPAVASVDAAGVASGKKTGAAVIRVELAGQSAEATLLVN